MFIEAVLFFLLDGDYVKKLRTKFGQSSSYGLLYNFRKKLDRCYFTKVSSLIKRGHFPHLSIINNT